MALLCFPPFLGLTTTNCLWEFGASDLNPSRWGNEIFSTRAIELSATGLYVIVRGPDRTLVPFCGDCDNIGRVIIQRPTLFGYAYLVPCIHCDYNTTGTRIVRKRHSVATEIQNLTVIIQRPTQCFTLDTYSVPGISIAITPQMVPGRKFHNGNEN